MEIYAPLDHDSPSVTGFRTRVTAFLQTIWAYVCQQRLIHIDRGTYEVMSHLNALGSKHLPSIRERKGLRKGSMIVRTTPPGHWNEKEASALKMFPPICFIPSLSRWRITALQQFLPQNLINIFEEKEGIMQ